MITEIGNALTAIISWVGQILTAVVSTDGAWASLLPLWCIGIGVSAVMLGIRVMRGFAWGN